MKNRLAMVFGTCFLLALNPTLALAQTTTTTTTKAPTTTTSNGGGGGGGGGSQQSSSSSSTSSSGFANTTTVTAKSTSSGTGSATGSPSTTNPVVQWYGDPFSMGLPSKWANGPPGKASATFGTANYTATGGTNASGGGSATTATTAEGFTTNGIVRNPQYTTVLSSDFPLVVHQSSDVLNNVKGIIERSSRLTRKDGIQVTVDSNNIVSLRGVVATERERLVAEGMVSMTPGVRGVQNELKALKK